MGKGGPSPISAKRLKRHGRNRNSHGPKGAARRKPQATHKNRKWRGPPRCPNLWPDESGGGNTKMPCRRCETPATIIQVSRRQHKGRQAPTASVLGANNKCARGQSRRPATILERQVSPNESGGVGHNRTTREGQEHTPKRKETNLETGKWTLARRGAVRPKLTWNP